MGCSSTKPLPVYHAFQSKAPIRKPHEDITPVFAVDDKSPVKITVRILQARNLLAKDTVGTSDPYAELSFGHQRFRTDIVPRNCNPTWLQGEFKFDPYFAHALVNKKGDAEFSNKFFRIEVFDDDSVDHDATTIATAGGKHSKQRRKKADLDGADDFLGRLDLLCPLWEHESQKWYLLRQRSKRSRVAGEIEVYVKVEINVNVRDPSLGPPPFLRIAQRGRQPLKPYPSSNMQGQSIIVRGKIFNEYFALPQYYCEIRLDAMIIRLDSQLAPVFVILKVLVLNASCKQVTLPESKETVVQMEFTLRGYANKITLHSSLDTEQIMCAFVNEARETKHLFPKRVLKAAPEYYGSGMEYYAALYESIVRAKDSIFIAGWMFTPEIYLKRDERPWNANHRLESILKTKAEEGVKIFILIYNDRDVAGVNAAHVVDSFENRHPNIQVGMHGPAMTKDIYWSHHSKFVVIDWSICFVGGMDLCVGRYDTPEHSVVDVELPYTFLGADYYNPRIHMLERLDKPLTERFDRYFEPRLPWQDITARYEGQIARDCGIYFIHRWTFALMGLGFRMKQGKRDWIVPPTSADESDHGPLVLLSSQLSNASLVEANHGAQDSAQPSEAPIMVFSQVDGVGPQDDKGEAMASGARAATVTSPEDVNASTDNGRILPPSLAMAESMAATAPAIAAQKEEEKAHFEENVTTVQLLRSFPYWAGFTNKDDVKNENSIYVNMLDQIEKSKKFIYIEQQFFISSATEDDVDFDIKMRDVVGAPCMQIGSKLASKPAALLDNFKGGVFYQYKQREAKRKRQEEAEEFDELQDTVSDRTNRFTFREDTSNVEGDEETDHHGNRLPKRFADNFKKPQFRRKYKENSWKRINVANKVALALFKRISRAIDNGEKFCIGVVMPDFPEGHYATEAYTRVVMHFQLHTLCRGSNSLFGRLTEKYPKVDLSQYIQFFSLRSFGFVGHLPIQESIYVHAKLLICDDEACLVGSANVNDRSLLGARDSETAVLLQTNGNTVRNFRKTLWSRHLGVDITDPLLDDPVRCLREVWAPRAKKNTSIYESVWPTIPSSRYTKSKEIPLGRPGPYFTVGQLDEIKGFVTEYPMYFLSRETLIGFEKEGVFVDDVMFT